MDPEIKRLLEHNTELLEENTRLLKKMNSRGRWGTFSTIIYWVFLIGTSAAAYYYLQPYIEKLIATYTSLQNGINSINNANPFR